jgi:hypothetical protein
MLAKTGCRANSCVSASSARKSAEENNESIAAASGSKNFRSAIAALSAVSRRFVPVKTSPLAAIAVTLAFGLIQSELLRLA